MLFSLLKHYLELYISRYLYCFTTYLMVSHKTWPTYIPLPSINILHLRVSEIQPGQACSYSPHAHVACGVKRGRLYIPCGPKNLVKITCMISEINVLLHFIQKFQMATKMVGKLAKIGNDSAFTLLAKCMFLKLMLFFHFSQKFKMAAKNGGKMIFAKNCEITLLIPSRGPPPLG